MKGAIVIEGHVQGLSNTRALGELGIPVYVIDVVHCLAQHSKYCKKYFRCPAFNSPQFITFLIELAQREKLEGWFLIGSNDHIVENLSLHYEELKPYYTMCVPMKEQLYQIIDKERLMTIAKQCGTHIPATCNKEQIEKAQTMRYPLLIKGRLGLSFYKATHMKAIQADDYAALCREMEALKGQTEDIMIQELVPFDEANRVVSFTCFAIRGEIKAYWMGKKLREHPIQYGTATMAESILLPEIVEEAKPLVAALGYTGTCEIEFMYDNRDGVWKLIEINPRTWLWVGLAKECGIDYAKMMYRYVNGEAQEFPTSYKVGVKWRNSITDFVYSMMAIAKGRLTLGEYCRSFRGEMMHAIWSWKDLMPGIIFPFMLVYIAKKRG